MKKFQARLTDGQGIVVEARGDGKFLPEDGSPIAGEFETQDEAQVAADDAASAAERVEAWKREAIQLASVPRTCGDEPAEKAE